MRLDENGNYFSDLICSYEETAKLQEENKELRKENKKLLEEIEDLKHELMNHSEKFDVEVPLGPVVFIESVEQLKCQHFFVGLLTDSLEVQRYQCNKCGHIRMKTE
jgi:hypothetical protein